MRRRRTRARTRRSRACAPRRWPRGPPPAGRLRRPTPRSIARSASSDSPDDERIGVARSLRHRRRLLEGSPGSLGLARQQVRLADQAERLVAPRTPRRLLGDRERRVGHHCSGPAGQRAVRSIARAEANDALPSAGAARPRSALDECRPSLGVLPCARSSPRPMRRARRAGGTPRWCRRRAPRATAEP